MPRINLDLSTLQKTRNALQDALANQRVLEQRITNTKAALDTALRAGESPNFTVPLQERIREDTATRAALAEQQRALRARIDTAANGLLQQRDRKSVV